MKRLFARNSWLKIISFILAVILWIFVVIILNPETDMTIRGIPVILSNSSLLAENDLEIINVSEVTVDIKVRGSRRALSEIDNKNITAYVDLSGTTNPGEIFPAINIRFPIDGLTLVEKSPTTISLKVDQIVTQTKPLFVEVTGTPAAGYTAFSKSAYPDTISVRGPQDDLNLIERAVVYIDVTDATDTVTSAQEIYLERSDGQRIESKQISTMPERAEAKCTILGIKHVPIIPDITGTPTGDRVVSASVPLYAEVNIMGDFDIISSITEIKTAPIDVSKMSESGQKEVALKIPAGVVLESNLEKVTVNIDIKVVPQ